MKIIFSNIIPPKGFIALNFFGILIWRKDKAYKLNNEYYKTKVLNHEAIHTAQMEDFCKFKFIGGTIFYILYLLEWLFRVIFIYPFSHKAYRSISFEKEAYKFENDLEYLSHRKRFAQWNRIE